MVGQLRAEDWDVGDGTGERDGQRTVQSAGIESYILDTWRKSRGKMHEMFVLLPFSKPLDL